VSQWYQGELPTTSSRRKIRVVSIMKGRVMGWVSWLLCSEVSDRLYIYTMSRLPRAERQRATSRSQHHFYSQCVRISHFIYEFGFHRLIFPFFGVVPPPKPHVRSIGRRDYVSLHSVSHYGQTVFLTLIKCEGAHSKLVHTEGFGKSIIALFIRHIKQIISCYPKRRR
jgi:hypothetical protein